jgi:hypothetical protein
MAEKQKNKKQGKRKVSWILIYIGSLVFAVLLKGMFLFILLGMLPSIVAHIADTSKYRETYRCVFACNLSGMLPYLPLMLNISIDDSMVLLADPGRWFVIYAFAGIGWMLVWLMPYCAEIITELSHNGRIAQLENMQRKLIDEWGQEIQRKL